jgi:hypothetical protein
MMMTMTLHVWVIEINLDIIKAERVLVSTRIELSAKGRTYSIRVAMNKTRCIV